MEAFDLLNKKIQRVIYEMKWESFRPIQNDAILHMITSPSDLILSAPTASGKTEAAFLPLISQIADKGKNSVKILYISPLKALINDQFSRVEALCRHIDFPITKWHGDAAQSKKTALIKNPAGILLITPESIEALFLNKSEHLEALFNALEYIVIDEIHSFIGSERGSQLKSLISRLEYTLSIQPYKIALSATISNLSDIAIWLNPRNPQSVKIINAAEKTQKDILGIIKCYRANPVNSNTPSALTQDLFKVLTKGKNLVFANAKASLEEYCDTMKQIAKEKNFPQHFYIHHGSLAKNIREECEDLLKTQANISVFCSSTLELGIDIGKIERVIFLDPPFSVSSMIQCLGRSGRKKNTNREFRFFIEENTIQNTAGKTADWSDKFRTKLVQCIAIVELMLKGFIEPLDTMTFDYSTFVQQILSYLGQTGGATASQIYHLIGELSFNHYFSKQDFIDILQQLHAENIIYQLPDNTITLGKAGEKIVENYEFYSAFLSQKEWKVMCNGKEIGQIAGNNLIFLKNGGAFLLAGKRWELVEIKNKAQIILVKEAMGKKTVKFNGGTQNIHRAIDQKMLEIYETNFIPAYLSKNSIDILQEGFDAYKTYVTAQDSHILPVLEGSRIQNTIGLLLKYSEINFENTGIGFFSEKGKNTLISALKSIDFETTALNTVLDLLPRTLKYKNKFDYLLSDTILNKSYIQQCLDISGAKDFIQKLQ